MQIPSVPTDNLYKFLAITGLVVFIFSAYFIFSLQYSEQKEFFLFNKKIAEINIQTDFSKSNLKKLQKRQEQLQVINEFIVEHETISVLKIKSILESLIVDDDIILNTEKKLKI